MGPQALVGLASAKPEEKEIVNQEGVFGHGGPLSSARSALALASRVPARGFDVLRHLFKFKLL